MQISTQKCRHTCQKLKKGRKYNEGICSEFKGKVQPHLMNLLHTPLSIQHVQVISFVVEKKKWLIVSGKFLEMSKRSVNAVSHASFKHQSNVRLAKTRWGMPGDGNILFR